jgi:3'(2'), 5'-bisphosphate nucleotidase
LSIGATGARLWLVDPLDGTREFVKRNGEFTVNIALVEERRAGARNRIRPGALGAVRCRTRLRRIPAAISRATRTPIHAQSRGARIRCVILGSRSHGDAVLEHACSIAWASSSASALVAP